jgi:DNA-binding response OmpR family regulator
MELRSLLLSRDEETISILSWAFEDMGITPELHDTIRDARSRAEAQKFDAIVVDCDVPAGVEFLESTQEMPANAQTVTFAVVNSDLGIPAVLQRGANLALQKPITLDMVRSTLRAAYGMIMEERRTHTRYPADVPAKIIGLGQSPAQGSLLNISEGGLAFECDTPFLLGHPVTLTFTLPGTKEVLEVGGEIVWLGKSGTAGIRFGAISATLRQRLTDWLLTQVASLTS